MAVAPILLAGGERLLADLGDAPGDECAEVPSSASVAPVRLRRTKGA